MLDDLAHSVPRLAHAPGPGQSLDEPERAGDKRALGLLLPAVAVEEPAAGVELVPNRVDEGREPFSPDVEEVHPGDPEHACVELAAPREHHVAAALFRPAVVLDEFAHVLGALAPPLGTVARELPVLDEPEGAIEGRPDPQLGDCVVLLIRQLPQPGILLCPNPCQMVENLGQPAGRDIVKGVAVADVQLGRLQEIAVAAELQLPCRAVPAPHRARAAIAVEA